MSLVIGHWSLVNGQWAEPLEVFPGGVNRGVIVALSSKAALGDNGETVTVRLEPGYRSGAAVIVRPKP